MPFPDGQISSRQLCKGSVVERTIATDAVTSDGLADGAVSITAFASGLTGVQIVSTLPVSASQGDMAFLTTNDKLYRYDGAAWTVAVDGTDIVAGSIVASDKIQANSITADRLVVNTITSGYIATGAVTTDELAANSVTAAELSALNLEVGKYIRSTTYTAGSAGFSIDADGSAEFNDVTVRGTIYATAGQIGGLDVTGSLTMTTGGAIRTAASGTRIEITSSVLNQVLLYHVNNTTAGYLAVTEDMLDLSSPFSTGESPSEIQLWGSGGSGGVNGIQMYPNSGRGVRIQGDGSVYPPLTVHQTGTGEAVQITTSDATSRAMLAIFDTASSYIFEVQYSGQINASDGSSTAPSRSFISDKNSGWYLHAADRPAVTAGGTIHMTWNRGANSTDVINSGLGVGFSGSALTTGYIYNIPPTTATAANATWVLASGSIYYLNRSTSSRRYKRDIEDTALLGKLAGLRIRSFTGSSAVPQHDGTGEPERDESGDMIYERVWDSKRSVGLIAEEVADVFPEAVIYDTDGAPDGIDWNVIVAALTVELNLTQDRLATLEATCKK